MQLFGHEGLARLKSIGPQEGDRNLACISATAFVLARRRFIANERRKTAPQSAMPRIVRFARFGGHAAVRKRSRWIISPASLI